MRRSSRLGVADFWTLVCATVMLLAFLILPWLVSATGMRVLMGTENVPQSVKGTPLLVLIPVVGALSLLLVVWGIFVAPRKRFAAWFTLLVAFAGLVYFVSFATANSSDLGIAIRFLGTGFWIALLANLGLVFQVAVPRPAPEKPRNAMTNAMETVKTAGGCLLTPIKLVLRPFRLGCLLLAFVFGACALTALVLPATFQALVDAARSASMKAYVTVLEVTGSPALKVITYEADVTAISTVQRDMGVLGLLYGEGAEVRGKMRVSLGADLKTNQVGVLSCAIDTDTLQTFVGRAPLAGTAFDQGAIERSAYDAFKKDAAKLAIDTYWAEARQRLQDNFISWGLGLTVPEVPTLATCPSGASVPQAGVVPAATPAAGK